MAVVISQEQNEPNIQKVGFRHKDTLHQGVEKRELIKNSKVQKIRFRVVFVCNVAYRLHKCSFMPIWISH